MNWRSAMVGFGMAGFLTGIAALAQAPEVAPPVMNPPSLSPIQWSKSRPAELSELQLQKLAGSVAVKVLAGNELWGSGVLIQRCGQVYTVLTNDHVLQLGTEYQVQTPEGRLYPASVLKGFDFKGTDLALVQFVSADRVYAVAPLRATASLSQRDRVFAAGFPFEDETGKPTGFKFTQGEVSLVFNKDLEGGYRVGYTNNIRKGMSGGPVLNGRGEVVAINGIHAHPIWGDPYSFRDGSKPDPALKEVLVNSSWGIPVETFFQLAPQFAPQKLALPSIPAPTALPLAELGSLAQEVTVAIAPQSIHNSGRNSDKDSSKNSGSNPGNVSGSGVLIAREDTTYYVLTTGHAIAPGNAYEVITHDGQRYPMAMNLVKRLPGVDLALAQFDCAASKEQQCQRTYSLASLSLEPTAKKVAEQRPTAIFVSGWLPSGKDESSNRHLLIPTHLADDVKRGSPELTAVGQSLLYTAITYPSIRGGPVFNPEGAVIGIHQRMATLPIQGQVAGPQLIYSSGISIRTFQQRLPQTGLNPALQGLDFATPKR